MFVLDTNVLSELRKVRSGKAHPAVAEWARDAPPGQLFLSAITIQELEHGVLLVERNDTAQGVILRKWLDHSVMTAFAQRILPVDEAVARQAAGLHVPDPAPIRDALIGATALVNGMAVATRNTKDFSRFDGLHVVDPWSPPREASGPRQGR